MGKNVYLHQLHIKNFATFVEQTIHFSPNLNIIVGETGAGKSLVIDALRIVLGGKADRKLIRHESEYSLIEASFFCADKKLLTYLEDIGFPAQGDEITIKRLIYQSGQNKSYLNHQSCNISQIQSISTRIADIVGQFENQKLLSENYQLWALDHYSGNLPMRKEYETLYQDYKFCLNQIQKIEQELNQREQRLDYLNYQVQEISRVSPQDGEEEILLEKKSRLLSLEKSQAIAAQAISFLENETNASLLGLLSQLKSLYSKNQQLLGFMQQPLETIYENTHCLFSRLQQIIDQEYSQDEVGHIIDRLDQFQSLKRKFGPLENLSSVLSGFLAEINQLSNINTTLSELRALSNQKKEQLTALAKKISQKRITSHSKFIKLICLKLNELNMPEVEIDIKFSQLNELGPIGIDSLEFWIQTNKGEGFHLAKTILSGGELSRLLLAIRQTIGHSDDIATFIFDEIDAGMGGDTALKLGQTLKEVSRSDQILVITHLPQVAQFADTLLSINKGSTSINKSTRTISTITHIAQNEFMRELKRMVPIYMTGS